MVSWLQQVSWEQSWANRAGGRFIEQMRRMSMCQTSYTSVLTDPDISIVCGQESHCPGSWIRANWGASAKKQQKVASSSLFFLVLNRFLWEQKSWTHALLNLDLSQGNTNDKLFFNIFFLTTQTAWKWCEEVACRQKWMALTKRKHHLSLFLGPNASL